MADPSTVAEVEQRIHDYSAALAELIVDHRDAVDRLAKAEAEFERAYHRERARLYLEQPKARVDMIESCARVAAETEAVELAAAKAAESFIRHAQHSYRQILSSYQTLGKFVADEAGHGRYGRR